MTERLADVRPADLRERGRHGFGAKEEARVDVTINYIRSDGIERSITTRPGTTVMQAAISNGVAELLGDCDGEMTCGTCHVFVDPAYLDRLPAIGAEEDEMLDGVAAGREPNSRLGCQLPLTAELSGITVRTPSEQL